MRSYIASFDEALSDAELASDRYSYRVLFSKKLTSKRGQADRVIEFVDPSSALAQSIDQEYWVQKEVERPKFLPTQVVNIVKDAGFTSFSMPWHTQLCKQEDAKNPAKGYGVFVAGHWYWYQRWIDFVLGCLAETAPESSSTLADV